MTGKVLKVLVENRQQVEAGQTLFIIEAMKMEPSPSLSLADCWHQTEGRRPRHRKY